MVSRRAPPVEAVDAQLWAEKLTISLEMHHYSGEHSKLEVDSLCDPSRNSHILRDTSGTKLVRCGLTVHFGQMTGATQHLGVDPRVRNPPCPRRDT